MGPEEMMKAVCYVVIEGETVTITDLNDSLYYIVVVSMGIKSTFDELCTIQKLRDSSCVCRGLYSAEGVSHEWALALSVVWDTSTWLK